MAAINALAIPGSDPSTAAFGAATDQILAGQAQGDYNTQSEQLNNQFVNRTLPNALSQEGMMGDAYSGNAVVRKAQATQDEANQQAQLGMQLHSRIADLTQNRLYSFLGV